ncbi:hypothetical protein C8J57DRAFT_1509120 [Mycena rebaudengoi]|nr:hypothetical protein C8J57DRAFT_1509120 [Mycena rebaudengoi]
MANQVYCSSLWKGFAVRSTATPCPLTTTTAPTLYRRAFSASPASPASLAFTFAFALRPPPPLFPAPTPRPPPFRPLFPSDHVLPSLPSLSLFFLHLIRLLILVLSLPYPRRARQHLISLSPPTTHYPPPAASKTIWSLDTLGSLVLSYIHFPFSPLFFLPLSPPTCLPTHPTPASRDGSNNADSVDEASTARHVASA